MLSYERRHLPDNLWFHKRISAGDSCLPGCPRNIEVNTDEAPSVGAALTPLHDYDLQAGSLFRDHDFLTITYSGLFANNANAKRVSASIEGSIYLDAGLRDVANGINVRWTIDVTIVRLSSTAIRILAEASANFFGLTTAAVPFSIGAVGGYVIDQGLDLGVPNLNINSINLLVSGQGVANGDVVQNLSIIDLVRH